MGPRKGVTGRALFDFLGEAAGDLVFFKDQVITDIYRIDDDWCRGKQDRYEGIFPSNLVAYDAPPPYEGEEEAPTVASSAPASSTPAGGPGPAPSGVANLDFFAEDDKELTLLKGDVVALVSHVDENWFRGTLCGKTGIFPKMCVDVTVPLPDHITDDFLEAEKEKEKEREKAKAKESAGAKTSDAKKDAAPSSTPKKEEPTPKATEPVAKGRIAVANCDFDAAEDSDLPFKAGDKILVLRELDVDWSEGEANGRKGIFPTIFVTFPEPSSTSSTASAISLGTAAASAPASSAASSETPSGAPSVLAAAKMWERRGSDADKASHSSAPKPMDIASSSSGSSRRLSDDARASIAGVVNDPPKYTPAAAPARAPEPATPQHAVTATGMTAFHAESSGDLAFEAGERIYVTGSVDSNWVRGCNGVEEGIFPRSFVAFDKPCARVSASFDGAVDGEVAVETNDVVALVERVDADWAKVRRADGKQGLVPLCFLDVWRDTASAPARPPPPSGATGGLSSSFDASPSKGTPQKVPPPRPPPPGRPPPPTRTPAYAQQPAPASAPAAGASALAQTPPRKTSSGPSSSPGNAAPQVPAPYSARASISGSSISELPRTDSPRASISEAGGAPPPKPSVSPYRRTSDAKPPVPQSQPQAPLASTPSRTSLMSTGSMTSVGSVTISASQQSAPAATLQRQPSLTGKPAVPSSRPEPPKSVPQGQPRAPPPKPQSVPVGSVSRPNGVSSSSSPATVGPSPPPSTGEPPAVPAPFAAKSKPPPPASKPMISRSLNATPDSSTSAAGKREPPPKPAVGPVGRPMSAVLSAPTTPAPSGRRLSSGGIAPSDMPDDGPSVAAAIAKIQTGNSNPAPGRTPPPKPAVGPRVSSMVIGNSRSQPSLPTLGEAQNASGQSRAPPPVPSTPARMSAPSPSAPASAPSSAPSAGPPPKPASTPARRPSASGPPPRPTSTPQVAVAPPQPAKVEPPATAEEPLYEDIDSARGEEKEWDDEEATDANRSAALAPEPANNATSAVTSTAVSAAASATTSAEQLPAAEAPAVPLDPEQAALARKLRKAENRVRVVDEIVKTEADFLRDLSLLVEGYAAPLAEAGVSLEECSVLFGNIHEVIGVSQRLLESLQLTIAQPPPEQQIGACFLASAEDIRRVYAAYCRNHDDAVALVQKWESDPAKVALLKERQDSIRGQSGAWDLSSFLIKPVQRVLKYPLLLHQLLECTLETHVDYVWLTEALEKIRAVAASINEIKRRKDIVQKYTAPVDDGLAVNVAKINLHSLKKKTGRIKQLTLQATGKASRTIDPFFEECDLRFRALERLARAVLHDAEAYSACIGDVSAKEQSLAEAVKLFYGDAFQRQEINMYQMAHLLLSQQALNDHLSMVKSRVIRPLYALLDQFPNPTYLIRKRNDKLLDFDKWANKVQGTKDAPKMQLDALAAAQNDYNALNEQLLEDLPRFVKLGESLVADCLRNFLKAIGIYYGDAVGQLTQLVESDFVARNVPIMDRFYERELDAVRKLTRLTIMPQYFDRVFEAAFNSSIGATPVSVASEEAQRTRREKDRVQTIEDVERKLADLSKELQSEHRAKNGMEGLLRTYESQPGFGDDKAIAELKGKLSACDSRISRLARDVEKYRLKLESVHESRRQSIIARGPIPGTVSFDEDEFTDEYSDADLAGTPNRDTPPTSRAGVTSSTSSPARVSTPSSVSTTTTAASVAPAVTAAPAAAADTPAQQPPRGEHFYALYDYVGKDATELSFSAGETLYVLQRVDQEGNLDWWLAQRTDGTEGYVPSNYLEPCVASTEVAGETNC